MHIRIWVISILVIFFECDHYPKDDRGTLKRVTGNILIAGVTENPPYIILDDEQPRGIEVDMIREFAGTLNADIRWVTGPEETIFKLLAKGKVDIAAGGFTNHSPWKKEVYFVNPHDTVVYTWAVPAGTSLPQRLISKKIYIRNGSAAGAFVSEKAEIIYKDSLEWTEPLIADTENELKKHGYTLSGKKLKEVHISFAIRNGENAFLKKLTKHEKSFKR